MDDYENPYLPPRSDEPTPTAIPADLDENADPRTIGKARRVPLVAILMSVHGVLMFLAGFCLIGVIIFIAPQLEMQIEQQQELQRKQNPNAPQLPKEAMASMLYAIYGGIAALLFVIGTVNIYAGIRNYSYRNRVLGIVSLILNVGSVFFCWCLPLSIGLMIFGLIVYLSPEADRAFRWRSEIT